LCASQLRSIDNVVAEFLRRLTLLIGDPESLRCRLRALTEKQQQLKVRIQRLLRIIESKKNPPEQVLSRIEKLEGSLRKTAARSGLIERLLSGSMIPTRDEVMGRLKALVADLDADQRIAGVAIRKIIRRIDAVPYLQFNSSVVVIRGRITVDVAGLLSAELASVLSELNAEGLEQEFQPTIVTVDLFKPSTGPAYGLKAEALERERDLRLSQVAKELGLNKRRADIALQYGRAMRKSGIVDPFTELKSAPENAAHWGPHKKSRRAQEKSPPATGAAPSPGVS
jgi:hypothetical protein